MPQSMCGFHQDIQRRRNELYDQFICDWYGVSLPSLPFSIFCFHLCAYVSSIHIYTALCRRDMLNIHRTFAMVMILMISTTSVCFHKILPPDIEAVIGLGQRNLNHFSYSVKEFEWHLKALERLDRARKKHNVRIAIANT